MRTVKTKFEFIFITWTEGVHRGEGIVLIDEGLCLVSGSEVNIIEGATGSVIKLKCHSSTESLVPSHRDRDI